MASWFMSGTDEAPDPRRAEASRWFLKASEDLQVARLAVAAQPPLLDPAAYHCQQAVEKLFKGLLVTGALAVPRTHDLGYLAELLTPRFPKLAEQIEALAWLSPWATETRYPALDTGGGPSIEDVQQAIAEIAAMAAAVDSVAHSPDE
jgi:HEPN domain-containing protein